MHERRRIRHRRRLLRRPLCVDYWLSIHRLRLYRNVMVIGADTFSNIIDWDRRDSVFFGDGAGAILLTATEEDRGFIGFDMNTDGSGRDGFNSPPAVPNARQRGDPRPRTPLFPMEAGGLQHRHRGRSRVHSHAPRPDGVTIDDIACMLPHQPSIKILKSARRVGLPWEKVKPHGPLRQHRAPSPSSSTRPGVLRIRTG